MDEAKIRLSAKEKRLVRNDRFILTKNAIMQKAKEFMGVLKPGYDELLKGKKLNVAVASAKISRGENYKGLPWVILDHPRYFKAKDILAIRTLFWWGQFFSITLHVAGLPKKEAEKKIIESFKVLRKQGFRICVNEDQWQHSMDEENYRSLQNLKAKEFADIVAGKDFIKLAGKVDLKKWEKAGKPLRKYFSVMIELVATQNVDKIKA